MRKCELLRTIDRLRNGLRRSRAAVAGRPLLPPGLCIGQGVYIGRSVQFDWMHAHLIVLEDECTIVDGTRILCHDASSNRRLGVTWVAPVRVGRRAFVGADAMILPGVTIGENAVVAAGAVVTRDVAPGTVVAGVPAQPLRTTVELDDERRRMLEASPAFPRIDYHGRALSTARLGELLEAARVSGGYFLVEPDAPFAPSCSDSPGPSSVLERPT